MAEPHESRIGSRFAILIGLVLGCGFVSGLLAQRAFAKPAPRLPVLEPFVLRFTKTFGLNRRQQQELRWVLEDREERERKIMDSLLKESPSSAYAQRLVEENRRADRRIVALLTPEQYELYRISRH